MECSSIGRIYYAMRLFPHRRNAVSYTHLNLSLKHRELLKQNYEVGAEAPVDEMRSVDGTVKYLYKVGERSEEHTSELQSPLISRMPSSA